MRLKRYALTVALVFFIGASILSTVSNYLLHQRVLDRLSVVDSMILGGLVRSSVTTSWETHGGRMSVTTYRRDGEDHGSFIARHLGDVERGKTDFPPR
jgi:hypothetical protein